LRRGTGRNALAQAIEPQSDRKLIPKLGYTKSFTFRSGERLTGPFNPPNRFSALKISRFPSRTGRRLCNGRPSRRLSATPISGKFFRFFITARLGGRRRPSCWPRCIWRRARGNAQTDHVRRCVGSFGRHRRQGPDGSWVWRAKQDCVCRPRPQGIRHASARKRHRYPHGARSTGAPERRDDVDLYARDAEARVGGAESAGRAVERRSSRNA